MNEFGRARRAGATVLAFSTCLALADCGSFSSDPVTDDADGGKADVVDAGAGAAVAPPVLVQSNSDEGEDPVVTVPLDHPTKAGNFIIVVVAAEFPDLGAVARVSDALGNTYVSADATSTSDGCEGGISTEIWYSKTTKADVKAINVETTEDNKLGVWVMEVSGISAVEAKDATNGKLDKTSLAAPKVVTTAASSFVVSSACACNDISKLDQASGFTTLPLIYGEATAYLITDKPGSYGATWTAKQGEFNASTVAFKP